MDLISYDDEDLESLKLALVLLVVTFLNTLLDFTQRQNAEKVRCTLSTLGFNFCIEVCMKHDGFLAMSCEPSERPV